MSPRPLVLALLAAGLAAPAAQAAPSTLGAYAFYQPVAGDPDYSGRVVVVLRTDAALPLSTVGTPRASARIDGIGTFGHTISRRLRCYGYSLDVRRGDPGIGDRVRVRLGRNAAVLDRTLTVRRRAADLPRGRRLGCGEDPASGAILFNLGRTPLLEPGRFFFSANAGPYLKDVRWSGWGGATATATATYVSDCASCGAPRTYPVTVTASDLEACGPYGARAYDVLAYDRSDKPATADERDSLNGLAAAFCR